MRDDSLDEVPVECSQPQLAGGHLTGAEGADQEGEQANGTCGWRRSPVQSLLRLSMTSLSGRQMKKICLLLLLGSVAAQSERTPAKQVAFGEQPKTSSAAPRLQYTSPTDRTPRPEPPLSPMGSAGTRITDPTFGNRILRVTDDRSATICGSSYFGRRMTVSGSAESADWNADSSRFYAEMSGGYIVVYRFDPSTMTAAPDRCVTSLNPSASWSWFDKDVFYAMEASAPTKIAGYNVATRKTSVVRDACRDIRAVCGQGSGDISVAQLSAGGIDSRFAVYMGGDIQDHHMYVYVYDTVKGWRALNTLTGAITGQWGEVGTRTGTSDIFRLHNARISKSGNYVRMTRPDTNDEYIWAVNTLMVLRCDSAAPTLCGDHFAWGWDDFANGDGVWHDTQQNDSQAYRVRNGDLTGTYDLVRTHLSPSPEFKSGKHLSWNNASKTNPHPPLLVSAYRVDNGLESRAWDSEIIGIETDKAGDLGYRFAHHHSWVKFPSGRLVRIAALSRTAGNVSVTTASAHRLSPGDTVYVAGVSNPSFDGYWVVRSVSDAVHFTYAQRRADANGIGGTAQTTTEDFYAQPHANISQDGKWALFSSNWEHSLGRDSSGSPRTDVFIVELK